MGKINAYWNNLHVVINWTAYQGVHAAAAELIKMIMEYNLETGIFWDKVKLFSMQSKSFYFPLFWLCHQLYGILVVIILVIVYA